MLAKLVQRTVASSDVIPAMRCGGREKKFRRSGKDELRPADRRRDVTGGVGRQLQLENPVESRGDVDRTIASPHLAIASSGPAVCVGAKLIIKGLHPAVRREN